MINSHNTSQLTEIDAIALKQKLDLQEVILVDVRESGEYATEHIVGSISTPLSTFDQNSIANIEGKPLVICCQSGMRSSRACQKLLENGHDHVMQLKGGLSSWKAAGLTVQADRNAPISLFRAC